MIPATTQPNVSVLYVIIFIIFIIFMIFYAVLHATESYLLQPLLQERAVRLPPAIIILAIVFLCDIGAVLGALLAAPLTVTTILLVRKLYVERALLAVSP